MDRAEEGKAASGDEVPPLAEVPSLADEVEVENHWKNDSLGHSDAYVRFLRAYYMPLLVKHSGKGLVIWLIVFIVCIVYGPAFLTSTKSNLDLPKGAPSTRASEVFAANYPAMNSWAPAFVITHSETSQSVIQPASKEIAATAASYTTKFPTIVQSVTGYYPYLSAGLTQLANMQVSSDNLTMVTTVSFQKKTTLSEIYKVCDSLLDWSESASTPSLSVYTTGIFPLFDQMQKQTSADFSTIDETVLPICIFILGCYLQSYRHMAISFVNLACTILLAFGILMPITTVVDINPFSPSILLSLGVAVSFDYSLFMLTRFKEELLFERHSRQDSVFNMLVSSGHVVCLSGSTLFVTFILLLIFPQNFLQSVGYTCSVVVLSSMLVNLSVTPCMLLQCECFSHFDPICFTKPHRSICCFIPAGLGPVEASEQREEDLKARASAPSNLLSRLSYFLFGGVNTRDASFDAPPQASVPVSSKEKEDKSETSENVAPAVPVSGGSQQRNYWFRISWFCTKHARAVLLVLCGVTIPFLITFLQFQPTSDDYLIYLQTSRSLAGLKIMKAAFNEGRLSPYYVIVTTGTASGVLTSSYFETEQTVVNYLLTEQSSYVNSKGITCLSYFQGQYISLAQALQLMNPATAAGSTSKGLSYRLFASTLLNADKSSSLMKMELTVPPNSQAAVPYIRKMRTALSSWSSSPPVSGFSVEMHLFGGYTTNYDVQSALYALVPVMISVTIIVVLVIIGASFGSVLLAARLVFTIFCTLCWTYGLMVLVYQPGKAQNDFAVLTPSILSSSGLYWIIPIMSFSILVGLALDYDIFLMSRVCEFRRVGWSDRASVCLAIEKTAGIITAAGTIMSISFAGLLIPKTIVLNQYGFSLFVGVALDTFVVRTFLVPSVFTVLGGFDCGRGDREGRLNWWPTVMPPLAYATDEEEEEALMRGLWVPDVKLPASEDKNKLEAGELLREAPAQEGLVPL